MTDPSQTGNRRVAEFEHKLSEVKSEYKVVGTVALMALGFLCAAAYLLSTSGIEFYYNHLFETKGVLTNAVVEDAYESSTGFRRRRGPTNYNSRVRYQIEDGRYISTHLKTKSMILYAKLNNFNDRNKPQVVVEIIYLPDNPRKAQFVADETERKTALYIRTGWGAFVLLLALGCFAFVIFNVRSIRSEMKKLNWLISENSGTQNPMMQEQQPPQNQNLNEPF